MEISAAVKSTGNIAIIEDDTSMREALSFQLGTAGTEWSHISRRKAFWNTALQNSSTA